MKESTNKKYKGMIHEAQEIVDTMPTSRIMLAAYRAGVKITPRELKAVPLTVETAGKLISVRNHMMLVAEISGRRYALLCRGKDVSDAELKVLHKFINDESKPEQGRLRAQHVLDAYVYTISAAAEMHAVNRVKIQTDLHRFKSHGIRIFEYNVKNPFPLTKKDLAAFKKELGAAENDFHVRILNAMIDLVGHTNIMGFQEETARRHKVSRTKLKSARDYYQLYGVAGIRRLAIRSKDEVPAACNLDGIYQLGFDHAKSGENYAFMYNTGTVGYRAYMDGRKFWEQLKREQENA